MIISIGKFVTYNYRKIKLNKIKSMTTNKDSIEETLRKSREVEERYKKFLQEKA